MPSFRYRSSQKELLDRDDLPFEDIRRNMKELDSINTYLGGHGITLSGLKQLLRQVPATEEVHITEIGSGGGDNLRVIRNWARKHQRKVKLTGIDINPECIGYSRSHAGNHDLEFILSDFRDVCFSQQPHIIFSSLFTHHFSDEELVTVLKWMDANSRAGFFINDLHRHPAAYYSIKALTRIFSKSYLVKHDAPLSVLRGFTREEWNRLFAEAGIRNFNCSWKWAFRWLLVSRKVTIT